MNKQNDTTDWKSKEKRAQFNTNCNALRINNDEMSVEDVYGFAEDQVFKGFQLYPDFVATQEVIDGETGKTIEEVIQQ